MIDIDGVKVGAENFLVCAGPCSVENEDDMVALGKKLKAAGANTFRGGAFKPRTSPYAFQAWHVCNDERVVDVCRIRHGHIIPSMAKAAVMSGANGLQIEVHEDPENAWSDGQQCLTPDEFAELMQTIDMLLEIEKKTATGKQIVQQ